MDKEQSRVYAKWFGKKIRLANTTNFRGSVGEIIEIDFASKEEGAMFGYHIKTKLESGDVVTSYKFDGLEIVDGVKS